MNTDIYKYNHQLAKQAGDLIIQMWNSSTLTTNDQFIISSVRSLDSNNANLRISVAPITPDTEASKQTAAMERQLKTTALVEASKMRTKKIKLFLATYCCPQVGTDPERIYEQICESLKCGKRRLYYLIQHARHNCLVLFQFINTESGVVQLFQLLNEIIPSEDH
ncbi:unnamed protein product [Rotaria socialis]|uniref:Uncharacterized protein n=1 Tax=Rotaria socialis TaxID=392032 RepID=A0A817UQ81_9BILA|nr:unnamed protein product [Rotaria socialis]CAF4446550.1 unnamed protein product [Rotaria socialis]